MAKNTKKITVTRLNIYLHDPAIRRQVKAAAARHDLSVSEYCLRAITSQLIRNGEWSPQRKGHNPLKVAIGRARRFQEENFGGRVFTVSSADLIREAREGQTTVR